MGTTTNARSLRALASRSRALARRRVDERAVVVARRARASVAPSMTSAASSSHHSSWASRDADVVAWARDAWAVSLERDDDVIDATLGRGRDALACAKMCPEGVVYGFDVEPDAVASARTAFERAGIDARARAFRGTMSRGCAWKEMAKNRPRVVRGGDLLFGDIYLGGQEL
jgi:Methylase of polypeptide chain release factors